MTPHDYGDWTYIRHTGEGGVLWFEGHLPKEKLKKLYRELGTMRIVHMRNSEYLRTGWGQHDGVQSTTGDDFDSV